MDEKRIPGEENGLLAAPKDVDCPLPATRESGADYELRIDRFVTDVLAIVNHNISLLPIENLHRSENDQV